jgi:hypothetical protein
MREVVHERYEARRNFYVTLSYSDLHSWTAGNAGGHAFANDWNYWNLWNGWNN